MQMMVPPNQVSVKIIHEDKGETSVHINQGTSKYHSPWEKVEPIKEYCMNYSLIEMCAPPFFLILPETHIIASMIATHIPRD